MYFLFNSVAQELVQIVPHNKSADLNIFKIYGLDVTSLNRPEVTDPQQLLDRTLDFIQEIGLRLDGHRARLKVGN